MTVLLDLLSLQYTWFFLIGIILLVFLIKVVKNIIATLTGIIFTAFTLFRIYIFLSDKI